jgi:hypothetical protein
MVPDFRRDDVWTPASAGVTLQETFYEIIKDGRKIPGNKKMKGPGPENKI